MDAYPASGTAPRFPTGAPVAGAVFSTGAIRRPVFRSPATDSPDTAIHPFANRRHRGIAVCYRHTPTACAGTTGVVGELYRSGIQLTGVAPAKYQAAPRNIASPFSTPRADLPAIGSRACTLVLRVARCGNVIRSPGNPHPAPDTGKVRRRCGRLSELSATTVPSRCEPLCYDEFCRPHRSLCRCDRSRVFPCDTGRRWSSSSLERLPGGVDCPARSSMGRHRRTGSCGLRSSRASLLICCSTTRSIVTAIRFPVRSRSDRPPSRRLVS